MRKTIKMLSLTMAAAMLFSVLPACNSGAGNQNLDSSDSGAKSVQHDLINSAVISDVASLNPFSFVNTKDITLLIYQSLGQINEQGEFVGLLMKDYNYSEDGLTMHCEIYDNIYDSEGNHITAEDVVWSYEMAESGGAISLANDCDGLVVTGDYTFDFKLKHKMMVGQMDKFTKWYIVSKAAYEASADEMNMTPVGTGPYKLTEATPGYAFTLEKNEDFWDKDTTTNPISGQNVDKIVFYVMSESAQRTIALENGSLDACSKVSQLDLVNFVGNDQFKIFNYRNSMSVALYPNCSSASPMSDINLRNAIFYAINSESIVQGITKGEGAMNHSVAPDWSIGYNADWAGQDSYYNVYDMDKAKEYLDQSGYNDETLNIMCPSEEELSNAAQIISSFLTQIGVKNKVIALEMSTFNEYMKQEGEWDIALNWSNANNYWIDAVSGELGLQKGDGVRSMNFIQDDELQEMISFARVEENATQENLNKVHDYIIENAYMYSLCNMGPNAAVVPSYVTDVCAVSGTIYYGSCTYSE